MKYRVTVELSEANMEAGKIEIEVATKGQAKAINDSLKATNNIKVDMSKEVTFDK